MKGILLAGGTGSRLRPATLAISKQLIPVYDKPLVYYPLCTLMLAGIREVLVITRRGEEGLFKRVLSDGSQWGIEISYASQEEPKGIAEALIIGEKFVGASEVCLILGDNIFYGNRLGRSLRNIRNISEAHIFGYKVKNPQDFGVVKYDLNGNIMKIIEKPREYVSDIAVTGLYFYPKDAFEKVKFLSSSNRGELEITELNNMFLHENRLKINLLERGSVWMDTGVVDNLFSASSFIKTMEDCQNTKICCPEEISVKMKFIGPEESLLRAEHRVSPDYYKYLDQIFNEIESE